MDNAGHLGDASSRPDSVRGEDVGCRSIAVDAQEPVGLATRQASDAPELLGRTEARAKEEMLRSSTTAAANTSAAPLDKARKSRSRLVFGLIAIAIGVSGGLYGWHWYAVARFQEVTDDAYLQADKVTVAPKVGGFIAQVLVGDNASVKAGQVLARIDARDYHIALRQMKADAAKQKASLEGVQAAIAQQKAAVDQARAELRNGEAALQFSQQEFGRAQNLMKSGSGTTQRVQQVQADLSQRRATLDKDRAALLGAQKQVVAYESLAASSMASYEHAKVNIDQANLNIDYTTITSPIDGVVGDRTLRVGQLVQPGTNLLTVVPMGKDIYLIANFKETQLAAMSEGQPVSFTVDAFPDHLFHGVVQSMSPGTGAQFALLPPENATGNFTKVVQRVPVRVTLDADPFLKKLRPGLSVEATVDIRAADEGTSVTRVGMRDAH